MNRTDIRIGVSLAAVAAFILLLGVLTGCVPSADAAIPTFVPPTPRPTPVPDLGNRLTATVTRGSLTAQVAAPGRIEALRTEELYFGAAGLIRDVYAEPGESVTEGRRIAVLDAYSLERDALQRAAELQIARLNLAQIESRIGDEVLQATSPISFELAIAQERVTLAQSLYDLAAAQLDQAVIVAPFTGTLTGFSRQRGSRVNAYDTVGTIADLNELRIVAWVPTAEIEHILVGNAATVELPGQSARIYRAVVANVAPTAAIHEAVWAHQVTLRWAPGEAAGGLPPTVPLDVAVTIDGQTLDDVLVLPAEAVRTFAGQATVEVLDTDGTIRSVPVSPSLVTAAQIAIAGGLEEGQVVIVP